LHQGKAREAEIVLREGIARARETDDVEVLTRNQINLGETMVHMGRFNEARDIATEVIDRSTGASGQGSGGSSGNDLLTMEARRLLGLAELGLGQIRAAELQLQQVAEWVRTHGTDTWRRARAQSAWGAYLVASGRYSEAEPILLQSRAALALEVGKDSTATRDADRRIRQLHDATGDHE
jgi:hypothetical protein